MEGIVFFPEMTSENRSILNRVGNNIRHRRQEQIAYRLWDEDGRQEGYSNHYWELAGEELRRQEFIQANIDNGNLVGHSGAEIMASGAIYRPYVPLRHTPPILGDGDDAITMVGSNRRWYAPCITFREYVNWKQEGF